MTAYNGPSTEAWGHAVKTYDHLLLQGGRLAPVDPPAPGMLPGRGEHAVGVLAPGWMTYQRYVAVTPTTYDEGGPGIVVGSQPFVAGYVLASIARGAFHRNRIQRESAPQWHYSQLGHVVLTTHRLWCEVAGEWMNFPYDCAVGLRLDGAALTLSYLDAEPLCLAGDLAPWCAAVIAHYRFGANAPQVVPSLHHAALALQPALAS
ncbi:hypothetical protein D5S17_35635 [Pseudonocardiaceae bacterium YIM PH 21723]|nr:hypothetical protein D5S17_35635 [Pseudonocardiaceae bacterium YIM PH 21723]